jgi:hypothetical protein
MMPWLPLRSGNRVKANRFALSGRWLSLDPARATAERACSDNFPRFMTGLLFHSKMKPLLSDQHF